LRLHRRSGRLCVLARPGSIPSNLGRLRQGEAPREPVVAKRSRRQAEQEILLGLVQHPEEILGLALAYLGRKSEAVREGERGAALEPVSRTAFAGAYFRHQLARIYLRVGQPDKALDILEELLRIPYYLSSGWLRIDPEWTRLRDHPRFRKLAGLV
jgi:tetratricopeptide (TPR) repeat protein